MGVTFIKEDEEEEKELYWQKHFTMSIAIFGGKLIMRKVCIYLQYK